MDLNETKMDFLLNEDIIEVIYSELLMCRVCESEKNTLFNLYESSMENVLNNLNQIIKIEVKENFLFFLFGLLNVGVFFFIGCFQQSTSKVHL